MVLLAVRAVSVLRHIRPLVTQSRHSVEESYISDSVLDFFHTLVISTGGNGKNFNSNFLEICPFDLDKIIKIDGPRGLRDFFRFSRLKNSPNSPKWGPLKMGKSQITRGGRANFEF